MRRIFARLFFFALMMSSAYAADISAPNLVGPPLPLKCQGPCEALKGRPSQAHPTTIALVCVVWDQVGHRRALLTFKANGVLVRSPILKAYDLEGGACVGAQWMWSHRIDEVDLCDNGNAINGHHSVRKIPSISRALQEAHESGRGYIRMSLTGTAIDPNWASK